MQKIVEFRPKLSSRPDWTGDQNDVPPCRYIVYPTTLNLANTVKNIAVESKTRHKDNHTNCVTQMHTACFGQIKPTMKTQINLKSTEDFCPFWFAAGYDQLCIRNQYLLL